MLGPAWPGQGLAVPVLCRKVPSGHPELPQPFQPPFGAGEASSAWGRAGVGSLLSQAPRHSIRVRVRVRARLQHPCRAVGTHSPALLPLSWGPGASECRGGFTQPADTAVCLVK